MKPLIFLLALTATLVAETMSLDAQIAQMQEAAPEERYELMNAIKVRISTMNAQQRAEAIGKLQQQLHVQTPTTPSSMQLSDSMRQQMQQQRIEQPKNISGNAGGISGNPVTPVTPGTSGTPGTTVTPGSSGNSGMGPQTPNAMQQR